MNEVLSDLCVPPVVYIDTNSLRELKFLEEVVILLEASKRNWIKLCVSEPVLWERARQQYELDKQRVIQIPVELPRYVAWFKKLFISYGVEIIEPTEVHIEKAAALVTHEETYFRYENGNDQRDALILSIGLISIAKSSLIICREKKLSRAFLENGYENIQNDSKKYVEEIKNNKGILIVPEIIRPDINSIDSLQMRYALSHFCLRFLQNADNVIHEYLRDLPVDTNKLEAKLLGMQPFDIEIRKRVLGYIQWFSPISKSTLRDLLMKQGYCHDDINSHAQRLKKENLLIETDNFWLPNTENESKEICEQAMAAIMPEILDIMGLA